MIVDMRVAAVQIPPVWLDPEATCERVCEWIGRAAD